MFITFAWQASNHGGISSNQQKSPSAVVKRTGLIDLRRM
jgi:hypothetical protein